MAKPAAKSGTPLAASGEEPLLNKKGRALILDDRKLACQLLGGLGAIMASWAECATALGIGEATLWRMFKRWPETQEAYEDGKNGGKIGLRRDQFALAKKNATMGIFLGLNYLGQQDLRNVHLDGKVSVEHSIVGMMLKEIDEESRGKPVIEHRKDEEAA